MIGFLKGIVVLLQPSEVLIDVKGVGYSLTVPFSTSQKLSLSEEVFIHVHTYHREDQLKLFGFYTESEKKIFEILLKVNGIGPSMAISILSGIDIDRFADAIINSDIEVLTRIPGIGKTKAEKIIFELSRKKNLFKGHISGETKTEKNDAIEALISLGYDEKNVTGTISKIVEINPAATTEELIKKALAAFSGHGGFKS
ncbi:MAG TPA: Holliday junction branch migration protein RuvA [Spirochaetota bacterium]|nr:Holliday junction branch migration protein RuvA [Spirochaetota bacterium]